MKILKKVAVCLLGLIVVAAAAIMILRWVNGAETARLEEVKQSTRDQYGYAKGLNRNDIDIMVIRPTSRTSISWYLKKWLQ